MTEHILSNFFLSKIYLSVPFLSFSFHIRLMLNDIQYPPVDNILIYANVSECMDLYHKYPELKVLETKNLLNSLLTSSVLLVP